MYFTVLYDFLRILFSSLVCFLLLSIIGVLGLFITFQASLVWSPTPRKELSNKTYLIFGASLGLGKALSIEFAKNNPKKLILVSRGSSTTSGRTTLDELEDDLKSICENVETVRLDVCSTEKVSEFFKTSKEENIDWVVICTGVCFPGLLLDQQFTFNNKEEDHQLDLNYFGSLNIVKALLASTFEPERLVFVGSLVCSGSFAGYSGYGASKYALKGLVDSLRNEFKFYNKLNKTNVHLYLPGSIDSPGYENENKLKPAVTKRIEGTVSLISCKNAARMLIKGVLKEFYLIPSDFIGYLACMSISGLTPRKHMVLECMALPLVGAITHFVANDFDNCSRKELSKRNK